MKGNFSLSAAVVSIIIITSCIPSTLTSVWNNDAYKAGPLKKVLVISVDRSPSVRELLENEFMRQVRGSGTVVVPAHTIFDENKVLDRKSMMTKINELGIDSIVVMTVVGVKDAGTFGISPPIREENFYEYYFACCQYVSGGRNLLIETKIFDAKDDKLIWSASSETMLDNTSLESSTNSFITSVIRHLRENKLLRR